jgi:isoleucyl-tRNA synthetase
MKERGCFQVIANEFVTPDTGTGIVHCAPGFGEDDYKACVEKGLVEQGKAPVPIDMDARFTEAIPDF